MPASSCHRITPVFGVITVNLNNSIGLSETICSFSSQTYSLKKLFIVDGNSTDDSASVIRDNQHIITSFLIEDDSGIYDAMNKGFLMAKSLCDYVIFLNTSDLFCSDDVLVKLSDLIVNRDTLPDLVVGKAKYIKRDKSSKMSDIFLNHKHSYVHIGSPFCHQACFFLSSSLPQPPYNISFKIAGDYALLCQLYVANASVLYTDIIISLFDPSGLSSNPRFGHITRNEIFLIRKNILKQPYILNLCVAFYVIIVGIMRNHFRFPYIIVKRLINFLASASHA